MTGRKESPLHVTTCTWCDEPARGVFLITGTAKAMLTPWCGTCAPNGQPMQPLIGGHDDE